MWLEYLCLTVVKSELVWYVAYWSLVEDQPIKSVCFLNDLPSTAEGEVTKRGLSGFIRRRAGDSKETQNFRCRLKPYPNMGHGTSSTTAIYTCQPAAVCCTMPCAVDTLQSTPGHSDSTSREDPDSRSENQDIYDVYEQTAPTNEKRSKEHKHTNRIREGQGQNAYVGEFHAD